LKKDSDKLDELKANQQTRQREIEMSNDQQKHRLIEPIIVRTTISYVMRMCCDGN